MAQITRYREGNVTVTLDEGLARWVEQVLQDTERAVVDHMEREVEKVYEAARADWPVRTGRSRDGLRTALTFDRTRGRVEGSILALVPYSVYIKPRKLRGKTTAWQQYARGPMTKLKKRLVLELGDVIIAGNRGSRGR
jgi:hypothetical protein